LDRVAGGCPYERYALRFFVFCITRLLLDVQLVSYLNFSRVTTNVRKFDEYGDYKLPGSEQGDLYASAYEQLDLLEPLLSKGGLTLSVLLDPHSFETVLYEVLKPAE
jgi:hypothetical protein